MVESKQDIAALRQEIRAQRERLIDEKIEKGLAIRRPVMVVGLPDPEVDYTAVTLDDEGREVHPSENYAVVVTGVPRRGRDDQARANLLKRGIKISPSDYDRYACAMKPVEEKKPPPLPQPTPEPLPSSPRYPVRCTVRRPDPDKNDPGQIIEASYTITGNLLSVEDSEGRRLGTTTVRPGDDLDAAARAVIREKHGKHTAFYDPIGYRGNVI
jgi:hypothetical protein